VNVFIHKINVRLCSVFSDAPLDLKIKSNMISDLFSLIGTSLFTYDKYVQHVVFIIVTAAQGLCSITWLVAFGFDVL